MQVEYLKGVQVMVTINIQCISNRLKCTDDVCFEDNNCLVNDEWVLGDDFSSMGARMVQ